MIDAALPTMIDEVLISRRKMSGSAVAQPAPRRHLIGISCDSATLQALSAAMQAISVRRPFVVQQNESF